MRQSDRKTFPRMQRGHRKRRIAGNRMLVTPDDQRMRLFGHNFVLQDADAFDFNFDDIARPNHVGLAGSAGED